MIVQNAAFPDYGGAAFLFPFIEKQLIQAAKGPLIA